MMSRKFVRFVGLFLILAAVVMLFSALKPLSLNPPPQNFRFFAIQVFTMAVLGMIGVTLMWNSYHYPYLWEAEEVLPPGKYQILSRERQAPAKESARPDYYYVIAEVGGDELGDRRWVIKRQDPIAQDTFEVQAPVVIPKMLVVTHRPNST
jgi:hypothetical protein